MSNPYTISVQYNAAKCGWTVICNDDADNFIGVRYYGQMDKAINFANQQCHKIMDVGFAAALTVYDRNGDRTYSVSPEAFARAWGIDLQREVAKDFHHAVEVAA